MVNIFNSWIFGKDIPIDLLSIFVLSLIGIFALRFYFINKEKKSNLYLALSFFMIALSFAFKILANYTAYSQTRFFEIIVSTFALKAHDALYFIGAFFYRSLMLIGLYFLYSIYQKKQNKASMIIIVFLILSSMYFTYNAYYIFHAASLIFLSLLTYEYFKNYKANKEITTHLLFYSFLIISISQVFFMFISLNQIFYAGAEIMQLFGYMLLLITFILVLKHSKKRK